MGFTNPGAWLFAALASVLIALYLWEQRRRRFVVPSLLMWETIPEAIVRTRFRPNFLFALQLALLLALIAGLADPHLRGTDAAGSARRHIFVLDISASMQAREGPVTRFDEARATLRRRIASLGETDEAMLITAAHRPHVAAALSRDRTALLSRLNAVEPVDTGTNLDLALAVAERAAAGSEAPVRIELFTDLPRSDIASRWRDRVGTWHVGETDDNLAIESLQVFQGRFQDYRTAHAHVAVHNFSHREAHGVLTLELDGHAFDRRGFSLAPRSARRFPVRDFPGPGILRAALDIDDALPADNRAYALVRPARPIRVLVVSDPSRLREELQRIASATPNLELRFQTPAAYEVAADTPADIVLFYRYVPREGPGTAGLYIYPTTDRGWLAARGEMSDVEVFDWDENHPVLRSLRPELPFPLRRIKLIDVPGWAEPLLTSWRDGAEIALAFAAERPEPVPSQLEGSPGGTRNAVVAFDLAADNLLAADHVNLLLFFLNLIDWLAPADPSVAIMRTGEVQVLSELPAETRRVVDPRGRTSTFPADAPLSLEASLAGEYRVSVNGTSRRVFANFVDPDESDIGRPTNAPFIAPVAADAGAAPPIGSGFGHWLYAMAAALLLIEWLVALREA